MAASSIAIYSTIWSAWCRHCNDLGVRPAAAGEQAIRSFVALPGRKREHRRRCLALLDRVYAHLSQLRGESGRSVRATVAQLVMDAPPNAATSFLDEAQRDALLALLAAPHEAGDAQRDRALVALAPSGGLKFSEMLTSSVSCVAEDGSWIEVVGLRKRRVHLLEFGRPAVAAWRGARDGQLLMFPGVGPSLQRLDEASAFRAVRRTLADSCACESGASRAGPQTLRNTHAALLFEGGVFAPVLAQRLGLARTSSADRLVAGHASWRRCVTG